MKIRVWIFIGLSGWLIGGCGKTEIAGGDTAETGNAITGIIQIDGEPVWGAIVTLYSENFNPISDVVDDSSRAITDSTGRYQISMPGSGNYNVMAFVPERNSSVLIRDIEVLDKVDTSIVVPKGELTPSGLIIVFIRELSLGPGMAFLPGTGIRTEISSLHLEAGSFLLKSVPAGTYPEIIYHSADSPLVSNIAPAPVRVESGSRTTIGPFAAWTDTLKIFVDTSPEGADVSERLINYPLLVRLDGSTEIFNNSQSEGADLRFVKPDGISTFPYNIETWDPAGLSATIWVRIDTIHGNNSSQFIYLLAGGPEGIEPQEGRVFEEMGSYSGVWHLNQDPEGTVPQFRDISGNENHGTGLGNMTTQNSVPSIIGNGLTLDSQFIYTANQFENPNRFTISFWFKTEVAGGKIIGFSDSLSGGDPKHDRHIYMSDDGRLHFGVYPEIPDFVPAEDSVFLGINGIRRIISSSGSFDDGLWHYVIATLSPGGQKFIVDGEELGHNPSVTRGQNYTGFWRMGFDVMPQWNFKSMSDYFRGTLDEVRISDTDHSDGWLNMNYASQKENSSVLKFE